MKKNTEINYYIVNLNVKYNRIQLNCTNKLLYFTFEVDKLIESMKDNSLKD